MGPFNHRNSHFTLLQHRLWKNYVHYCTCAWGVDSPPDFYQPFLQALAAAGHDVRYAGYPSLDPADPTTTDCQADTDAITNTLRPIVEEGKDVLLLQHSYAGMPGAAAAVGLGKVQRHQEGKAGGVIGLVFIGAFVVPEGLRMVRFLRLDHILWQPSAKLNIPDDPTRNFAGDVDSSWSPFLEKNLRPHATLSFTSPQPYPAWVDGAFRGRLAFIATTEDKAVPKEAQYGMMAATQQQWVVKEIAVSHCAPFLDRIQRTVELTQEIVQEFSELDLAS
ncbi:hypothetical protein N7512_007604 [Penicillium capsulatum]|nr:hypothetical protein N7512_007604 [Penicillium capsulatum]